MVTLITSNINEKFSCEKCDFICSKKGDWNRHLATAKHFRMYSVTNDDDILHQNAKDYVCDVCSKVYNSRNGLWVHKKKCKILIEKPAKEASESDIKLLTNLILEVVKSNQSLQEQMLEVCKNGNSIINGNTINSNNNHSNNKTFNLNFFLNEQCKDAMNIMDFVNTFQLQLSDLERIGEVGYVEGISSLIIEKLNGMDIYKRPIHCSDAKRETMHIKDNDVWQKDNENNDKLRLAIRHITKKNCDLIKPWADKHPGVLYSDHRLNDKYQEIIMEAMGGKKNVNMNEGEAKIIKKISKMVLIDKRF